MYLPLFSYVLARILHPTLQIFQDLSPLLVIRLEHHALVHPSPVNPGFGDAVPKVLDCSRQVQILAVSLEFQTKEPPKNDLLICVERYKNSVSLYPGFLHQPASQIDRDWCPLWLRIDVDELHGPFRLELRDQEPQFGLHQSLPFILKLSPLLLDRFIGPDVPNI